MLRLARTMLRMLEACALLMLIVSCDQPAPAPLRDVGAVTHLIVSRSDDSAGVTLAQRADVDSVVAFARSTDGWVKSAVTLPSGMYRVRLMRDSVQVGALWFGPSYIVARRSEGDTGGARIRNASATEVARLRRWLHLPEHDSLE